MFHYPLVSVVMPAHNAGKYLLDAVKSILNQQYPNLELILVDDHSTDLAMQQLPETVKQDARLRVVSSPSRGVVSAMNYAAGLANGEFIARMDADDIALPDRFIKQINYLQENPDISIAGGQVEIFHEKETGQGFQLYQAWINKLCNAEDIERELFIESPIPNPTAVFRRDVYHMLQGYHDSLWAEDYDMWLRAHALGLKMGKPEGLVLKWRDHHNRLTRRDERYSHDLFLQAKGHYLARSYLKHRSAVIWGTGPTGVRMHDILGEYNIKIEAFIEVHPRRIGGSKRGLPVLPVTEVSQINGALVLGAVGSRGAREEIREALLNSGKQELGDFIFIA